MGTDKVVIVDTSVWIDYLEGVSNVHSLWLDGQLNRKRLGLTDLILCEILQGVRTDKRFTDVRRSLSTFDIFDTCGKDLSVASALNYRYLRGRGYTVRKTIDCLIATFCIRAGHSLLHRDRDFDLFEKNLGLAVIHPRTN